MVSDFLGVGVLADPAAGSGACFRQPAVAMQIEPATAARIEKVTTDLFAMGPL
jgi:hypothetical protein